MRPNHNDALRLLGMLYVENGRPERALPLLSKLSQKQPNNIDILTNLGFILWVTGRDVDARAKFEQVLKYNPHNVNAITNIGALLQSAGQIDEALERFNQALNLSPDCERAIWGKSLTLLAAGEYREGWKLYDIGLGRPDMRGNNPFNAVKPWDGRPEPDKHLLIWCEQGLGDSLQFVRYAELCKQRVKKVSVLCQKPLVRIFGALPFIDDAFDAPQKGRSNFDEHVPMMSLPHCFDTSLDNVPAAIPYLHVAQEVLTSWTVKFAGVTKFKIGLVWAGDSYTNSQEDEHRSILLQKADRQRSIGLAQMKTILQLPGIQFYSLQKGAPAGQIITYGLADSIVDFMEEVADFADTAAIVQHLDLIITVDTSVAHLAGGLGKPVWILSRYNADWRWLQNRPTSPWYPTARIFGQPALGDWDSVIVEIQHELAREVERHNTQQHML